MPQDDKKQNDLYPFELEKVVKKTQLFDLLLAIIVDRGWQNPYADPEVVCCICCPSLQTSCTGIRNKIFLCQ